MAIGFERQQASLIGGGDLPQARASAIVPDLGGFQRLAGAFLNAGRQQDQDAKAKQGIQDQLAGLEAGAAEGQTYVGKGPDGYVPFEVPDGSAEYQRSYIEGFNQAQDGKFQSGMNSTFDGIQARVTAGEITSDQATALMNEYVKGALTTAPAHRRGAYFEASQREIAQRSGLMTSQAASRDAQIVAEDLVAQTKMDINEATSKASAGGDPNDILAKVDKNYDTLVGLKKIAPKEAEAAKLAVRQVVAGQAMTNQLTTAMMKGEVDPTSVDLFGTAIDTNNPEQTITVNKGYQVGPGAKSSTPRTYKAEDVFKHVTDESIRKDMSLKLRTAATEYKQAAGARQAEKAFGEQLRFLHSADGRFASLPTDMRDSADALMAKVLVDAKPFDDPRGAAGVMTHMAETKYVPKPLVATLTNMANSGDPTQVEKAVSFYRMMATLQNPAGDAVGEALRASMPDDARSFFDNLSENMLLGYTAEDIGTNMKKARGNPEYGVGNLIGTYNTKVKGDAAGDGFWQDFRAKWAYDYSSMPDPQAKNAFANAYRQNMIMTSDPEKSFANAYERVTGLYRKNPIMLDGIEIGPGDLTNPPGYEVQDKGIIGFSRPGMEYEWLNDAVATDLVLAPGLVMPTKPDGTEMTYGELADLVGGSLSGGVWEQIVDPSKAFNSNFLGKTGKLFPVPGADPNYPEYGVRLFDKEGHDLGPVMVEDANGNMRPFTTNPHFERAQAAGKFAAKQVLDAAKAGAETSVGILQGKYLNQLTLDQSMGYDQSVPFEDYLGQISPELEKKYLLDRKTIEDGLDAAAKHYEEQTGEPVGPLKIGPQTLLKPRAAGFEVAAAAAATVDSVLPDGTGGAFLLRLSAQESNFGMAQGTYRLSGDKGMTQVNTSSGFKEVKRRIAMGKGRVYDAAVKLSQGLGVDMLNLTKDDLDKPIVAMAVARLYVVAVGKPVPQDVAGQGAWWKKHYNTYLGAGTASQFIRSAQKVPDDWRSRISKEG